jgi:hypothetical protein
MTLFLKTNDWQFFFPPIKFYQQNLEMSEEDKMKKQLNSTIEFLKKYEILYSFEKENSIEDFHKFFVTDQWNKKVPNEWHEFLKSLSIENYLEMVKGKYEFKNIPNSLETFIKNSQHYQLDKSCIKVEKIDIGKERKIKPKKKHEVERMTKFISDLAKENKCTTIVDIGSGRGYISNLLSSKYSLNVIGIDDKENITESSIKRNKIDEEEKKLALITSHIDMKLTPEEFQKLLEPYMKKDENFILIGLHTCGDLAATMIKLYENSSAKALVNVGCCYHRLTEMEGSEENKFYGFPMSEQCKSTGISLNYGKYLGTLSMNSWEDLETSIYYFKRNSFRVALEYLLISNVKDVKTKHRFHVKVSSQNSNDFVNYALNALSYILKKDSKEFNDEFIESSTSKDFLKKFYSQFDPDPETEIIKEVACYWSLRGKSIYFSSSPKQCWVL